MSYYGRDWSLEYEVLVRGSVRISHVHITHVDGRSGSYVRMHIVPGTEYLYHYLYWRHEHDYIMIEAKR